MTATRQPFWPASRIAAKRGVSPRRAAQLLQNHPPDHQTTCGGQVARAWSLAAMPEQLRRNLETLALQNGYRTTEDFLSAPPGGYASKIPLSQIAEKDLGHASKLQRALAPSLAGRNDASMTGEEFERRGVADYAAVFGHPITPRHFRRLLKRTLDRDAGEENWAKLDLYVAANPVRKARALPALSSSVDEHFRELHDVIARFKNQADPSNSEESLLWLRALEIYEAQTANGVNAKKLKRGLLNFLWKHARWAATSWEGLRIAFYRRLKRWQQGERNPVALVDGHEKKRGVPTGKPFEQDSLNRVTWHAVTNCGGRVSQAVRELGEWGELDPDLARWFMKKRASKSAVLGRLREATRYEVKALRAHHQGPRAARKTDPPLDLHYDGIASMDALVVDDFTWPIRLRVPDGKGWWRITRGQCILVIDFRTLCILSFGLQEEEQPNSLIARTALVRAFREHGLPDLLYIERGKVFADSKLITGGPKARRLKPEDVAFSDAEVEFGLRRFGIEVIVARAARSKPVERVGGMLQDLTHGELGYCGRRERYDCPEETIYWQRELERGNPKALEHFYTMEQWDARLWELCERFNASRHDAKAKRLPDLSPLEGFQKFWPQDDPPRLLEPELEFLLAHHRIDNVEVKEGGISFQQRGEVFRYFDNQTAARKFQKVVAFFNPEAPERCTFTDRNMRNAFTVERHKSVNALYPDETFEHEIAKARSHTAVTARRYRELARQRWANFRKSVVLTPQTVALGQQIERAEAQAVATERQEKSRRKNIRNRVEKLGLPQSLLKHGDHYEEDGTDLMVQAKREHAQTQRESQEEQT